MFKLKRNNKDYIKRKIEKALIDQATRLKSEYNKQELKLKLDLQSFYEDLLRKKDEEIKNYKKYYLQNKKYRLKLQEREKRINIKQEDFQNKLKHAVEQINDSWGTIRGVAGEIDKLFL